MKRFFLFLLSSGILFSGSADMMPNPVDTPTHTSPRVYGKLDFSERPSYVFSSFKDDVLQKITTAPDAKKIKFSNRISLQYGFIFSENSRTGRIFPAVSQGLGIDVNLFEHLETTGVPVSLYAFQRAPVAYLSERVALDYEWNFGVSGGWKQFNGREFHSNVIVGSRFNAYINLGVGVRYRLSNHFSLTTGLELTHYSNGNTSFPNPGVNMLGVRIGLTRTSFSNNNMKTPFQGEPWKSEDKSLGFDLTGYGAWRRRVYRGGEEPVLLNGHFGVAGISFSPMWQLRNYLRVGFSTDFQWDGSTDLKHYYHSGTTSENIKFRNPPFFSQVCAGVAGRGELVMPFFSVNLGWGYNLMGPVETRAFYQMANLKLYITPAIFVNVGYQLLNFKRQNNLMLGLGYTFRSSRASCTTLSGL